MLKACHRLVFIVGRGQRSEVWSGMDLHGDVGGVVGHAYILFQPRRQRVRRKGRRTETALVVVYDDLGLVHNSRRSSLPNTHPSIVLIVPRKPRPNVLIRPLILTVLLPRPSEHHPTAPIRQLPLLRRTRARRRSFHPLLSSTSLLTPSFAFLLLTFRPVLRRLGVRSLFPLSLLPFKLVRLGVLNTTGYLPI